jgi:sulfur carrier protein
MTLIFNGETKDFADLAPGSTVQQLVDQLGFKDDRVAVELNGEIVSRKQWAAVQLNAQDRLEVVHFVGGG